MIAAVSLPASSIAAVSPEIRVSASNAVPACVTPERLMTFLKARNRKLDPRYNTVAAFYKHSGEAWRVRWDYAFFQMAVETNFLTYRRPDGRMGDVDPDQNNFAGIGTTGGGVPGDRYPDIKTGVLAQIQHLVVYSGEEIAAPVAPRTQLKQPQILLKSRELNRPVRFADLARRWAADPKYGGSIEWVADSFRAEHCRGKQPPAGAEVLPWAKTSETAKDGGKPAAAASANGAPAQTAAQAPSFRTIWSAEVARNSESVDESAKATAGASPAAKAPVADTLTVKSATIVETDPVAQAIAPAVAPAQPPSVAAAAEVPPAEDPVQRFALVAPPANFATISPSPYVTAGEPPAPPVQTASSAKPAFDPVASPPSGLGVKPEGCSFTRASYGGTKSVLIRVADASQTRFIALTVLDGFEKTLTDSYIRVRAAGGEAVGEFENQESALAKARELCPDR
jgi:predicted DNA-binding WGR domain protein